MSTTTLNLMSLLSSPTTHIDDIIEPTTTAMAAANATSTIKISRPFELRRVQNSQTEVRLSMDVPVGIQPKDLEVHMEQDKDQEDVYLLRIGSEKHNALKSFPLAAESIQIGSIQVYLNHDVLEIIAYKTSETSTNPFQMVAEAFQTFTLNTWSNNPNKILRKIPVEEKQEEETSS